MVTLVDVPPACMHSLHSSLGPQKHDFHPSADLMDPGLEHVQCIRCLVADLETPVLPQNNITSRARDHNSGLNEDQEAAVDR